MIDIEDVLRTSSGWEGQVIALPGDDTAVLRMNDGSTETHPLTDLTYNSWDPKAGGPTIDIPTMAEQIQSLLDAVNQLILDSLEV